MDIWYTALFVGEQNDFIRLFSPKHEKVFAHHSTITFEPGSLDDIEVGKVRQTRIIARVVDDKGDALFIGNPKSKNKYPHITISCAPGVDPIYSNELIERAIQEKTIEYFKEPIFIKTVEGYGDHAGKVILGSNPDRYGVDTPMP